MFRYIYQSSLTISNFLWVPIGILTLLGLIWWCVQHIKQKKDFLFWAVLAGALFAYLWRWKAGVTSGRYFSIMIVPSLFLIVNLIWHGPLNASTGPHAPFGKKIRYFLLVSFLVLSFSRGFSDANPMDHKMLQIYHKIQEDSKQYSRVYAVSFTKNYTRERFFTMKGLCCPDRQVPLNDLSEGFFQNLQIFDGDYDVCYLFLEVRNDEIFFFEQNLNNILNNIKSAELSVFDECWNNEHQKKKCIVLKYLPNTKAFTLPKGELIGNGDFQETCPPDIHNKLLETLGRRSSRFLSEGPVFPLNWNIYQSLTTKSDIFATIVSGNNGRHSLRLEAPNSYIVAISPWFRTDDKSYLGFDVFASTESELQLSRQIRYNSGRNELYPVTVLKLEPESTRHYSIKLKAQPDEKDTDIWFWLKNGNVEISNVRIECQTND